jgi:DNA-binding XRE family transcriptional regulator
MILPHLLFDDYIVSKNIYNVNKYKYYFEERGQRMRENLKNARKAAGLTQQQAAEYLNVTRSHYQMMEQGDRVGSVELWDKLEDLFNIHQRKLREIS